MLFRMALNACRYMAQGSRVRGGAQTLPPARRVRRFAGARRGLPPSPQQMVGSEIPSNCQIKQRIIR